VAQVAFLVAEAAEVELASTRVALAPIRLAATAAPAATA